MGQQLGRAEDAALAHAQAREQSKPDAGESAQQRSESAEARISSKTRVDGGYVVRQGLYAAHTDYADQQVRQWIVDRKLSPFYPGADEEEALGNEGAGVRSECPICFLYYPLHLNRTRCCMQPICTECFVQIQRVDPASKVPPTSQPAACPFCVEENFGVVYTPAASLPHADAEDAIERAATAIGTGGAHTESPGRTRYPPDDERVVLVDDVHPNWQEKLHRALRTAARQANRRVIMRQEGDTLIPIGVSSSRTGDALAAFVAQNNRIGHSGPGGSIVLHGSILHEQLQRHMHARLDARSRTRHPRRPQIGDQMARTLASLSPEELETIMLRETMRISRLEHEGRTQTPPNTREAPGPAAGPTADAAGAPALPSKERRRFSLLPRKLARGAAKFGTSRRHGFAPTRASLDLEAARAAEREYVAEAPARHSMSEPPRGMCTSANVPSTRHASPERQAAALPDADAAARPTPSTPASAAAPRASIDTPRSSLWAERALQQRAQHAQHTPHPPTERTVGRSVVPPAAQAARASTNPFRT